MWIDDTPRVRRFENVTREVFERDIVPAQRPALLKRLVGDWPLVKKGRQSPETLVDYLKSIAAQRPVQAWIGAPEMGGRFSYSDDVKGRNHEPRNLLFPELADLVLASRTRPELGYLYAGGIPVPQIMPQLAQDNTIDLIDAGRDRLTSLWFGNRTRTAAHWDLPQNLACVVAGRRRFTLFPIDQIKNLYVGPVDFTLAGQPISLVDFLDPDLERFPLFAEAMMHAEVADLEPGDALYMPGLWFHHVEALDDFGAMVNFWWRDGPDYLTTPLLTMYHALLTLKDMPADERLRWRTLFDHYIFRPDGEPMAHLAPDTRGLFGDLTDEQRKRLKDYLIQTLSR